MKVEQFAMAYGVEQDRIRAMLPDGFESLRPVLRINAEIRDEKNVYLELNTPVSHDGKRGWINIANWKNEDGLSFRHEGKKVTLSAPFLFLVWQGTGLEGGCPAEKDNDGCFFLNADEFFRPNEKINKNKEFCNCEFAWKFSGSDASGKSEGKTLPAFAEEVTQNYEKADFTPENAAKIPCRQVLGAYIVRFERKIDIVSR